MAQYYWQIGTEEIFWIWVLRQDNRYSGMHSVARAACQHRVSAKRIVEFSLFIFECFMLLRLHEVAQPCHDFNGWHANQLGQFKGKQVCCLLRRIRDFVIL